MTSQPTAACPCDVFNKELSINPRKSTTVLATEIANPKMIPAGTVQPQSWVNPKPNNVAIKVWINAPGIAISRTRQRSAKEKWRPTPNIRKITPSSASC